MKITLFGASGMIGAPILEELSARGHAVSAVVRDTSRVAALAGVTAIQADIFNDASVAAAVSGSDVVVSAYGPGPASAHLLVDAFQSLLKGLATAGVTRLIAVGGAGSLEVAPGLLLIDAPFFPAAWKEIAQAHSDALEVLKASDIDWTSVSPAAMIQPGERTGTFRLGKDQLLTDANGESKISTADFAIAVADEVERNSHVRQRFTVSY